VLLQRHGLDRYGAPHAIDHRGNLGALAALAVDRVLAISSVGSLLTLDELEQGREAGSERVRAALATVVSMLARG
jgi:purine nucleoside phosphorylase